MNIDQETIEILSRAQILHNQLFLQEPQLARPVYEKVAKVLDAAGGKWMRKSKCHVFDVDPTEIIEQAILTGTIRREKQELGIFYTPAALARRAAGMLRLHHSGITVLEPSAGMGALAKATSDAAGEDDESCSWADITCMDIKHEHVVECHRLGFTSLQADFLKEDPMTFPAFDRIIMNPPFAKQSDALHVLHAMNFLAPGGRLVAIMSAAITFRETGLYPQLRLMATSIEPLPAGSFKESGTDVNAALVTFDKPNVNR